MTTSNKPSFGCAFSAMVSTLAIWPILANNTLSSVKIFDLTFPVVYELYNVYINKIISLVSVIAIGGIALTGGLSLLNVSPGWLAVRRCVPYVVVALATITSYIFKNPWLSSP